MRIRQCDYFLNIYCQDDISPSIEYFDNIPVANHDLLRVDFVAPRLIRRTLAFMLVVMHADIGASVLGWPGRRACIKYARTSSLEKIWIYQPHRDAGR